jgi:hypothetical protein
LADPQGAKRSNVLDVHNLFATKWAGKKASQTARLFFFEPLNASAPVIPENALGVYPGSPKVPAPAYATIPDYALRHFRDDADSGRDLLRL